MFTKKILQTKYYDTTVYFIKEMLFESVTSNSCTTSTRIDKLQFATTCLCSEKNDNYLQTRKILTVFHYHDS